MQDSYLLMRKAYSPITKRCFISSEGGSVFHCISTLGHQIGGDFYSREAAEDYARKLGYDPVDN